VNKASDHYTEMKELMTVSAYIKCSRLASLWHFCDI